MKAVRFDHADPEFGASLVDVDEPDLPNGEWARVQVTVGGICGSDLHLFSHNSGPSPALRPMAAFPFLLGHEIAGTVIEVGADCDVALGTRVAIDPDLPCEARGIEPACPSCARGWESACLNTASRVLTPGMSLGYTMGLGGGWAEQVLAHRSRLHVIPDGVPDRGASLHEPVSIAAHGLLRSSPGDGDPVLVVGAGIIGLAALAATRALFPASEVTVVARHEQQADAARACGAHHVVRGLPDFGHFPELAEICGARVSGTGEETMLLGGFPYVIEAVGYPGSVNESLRAVDNRGTVMVLGAATTMEVDLTPVWWKEAALVGAMNHAPDAHPHGGPMVHSVDRALAILAAGGLPDSVVVTHEFPLEGLREAVHTAIDRDRSGAIKVVFRPNGT
jgi:L-iditol 2-dehydrogenase